jgi:hypothetical protein
MIAIKLKQFLAKEMAKIDTLNEIENNCDFSYHYERLLSWRDFDLLYYWIDYNGIFDGGIDLLNNLNIK